MTSCPNSTHAHIVHCNWPCEYSLGSADSHMQMSSGSMWRSAFSLLHILMLVVNCNVHPSQGIVKLLCSLNLTRELREVIHYMNTNCAHSITANTHAPMIGFPGSVNCLWMHNAQAAERTEALHANLWLDFCSAEDNTVKHGMVALQ